MMTKKLRIFFCCFVVYFLACFILIQSAVSEEAANEIIPLNQYGIRSTNPYVVNRFIEDGKSIDQIIVPGSPHPPAGVFRARVLNLPQSDITAGVNIISNIPALSWSFGCSPTTAAMMFGHYDNSGYPIMYTGPNDGGVFPMTNETWGTVEINGETMALCPLSATRLGLDGRTDRGHVDDYWIEYDNPGPDPFIGNWTEHIHGECTADYMGTNQSMLMVPDGATAFFFDTEGDPLYDFTGAEPDYRDGCHGLRLFAESRGYTVSENFSQYIYGYDGNTQGFTFDNFKTEINAGRPVLIHVEGHTMLGYGYDDIGATIYIHDTWDYSDHSMTWGGTYSGMQHYGVSTIVLADNPTFYGTYEVEIGFDPEFYLYKYSDLGDAGYSRENVKDHWLTNGIHEGRQGSETFDVNYYLQNYPDLQQAYGNDYYAAFTHWLNSGIYEGRQPSQTFDPIFYLQNYPDLQQAFGDDYYLALSHWIYYGVYEGRKGISTDQIFTNTLGMDFVYIAPSTFTMGSPEDEPGRDSDETQHQVTLTQGYYMQTTEVTQGQWEAVMGSNPSYFSSCGTDCPVEYVSWDDIQEFIDELNQSGEGTYSLPTEAQWEYAARAGSTSAFANGEIIETGSGYDPNLDSMGWYTYNSGSKTHPVAQKTPNAWGLYDMHGNVWEWCQDWYGDYTSESVRDPAGPSSGSYCVIRGGSWYYYARYCRSAYRYIGEPGDSRLSLGFRLVLLSPDQQ